MKKVETARMAEGDCEFGGFMLQCSQRRLLRGDGTEVELTPRLFSALLFFVQHAGELLEKEDLLRALWPNMVVEENNLHQTVAALRRALGDHPQDSRFIQTVPRRGFCFVAHVAVRGDDHQSAPLPPVTPSPEVDRRVRRLALGIGAGAVLMASGAGWWVSRRPLPIARASTVAVLPFRPLATGDDDGLLEIGVADSLIARLSAVPGLVVRSTGSVMRYAGTPQDPLRAAKELQVHWVIDGSLQHHADVLRTTARLLDAGDGIAAWSGGFDEKFTNVFEMQDRISQKLMEAVLPALHASPGPSS